MFLLGGIIEPGRDSDVPVRQSHHPLVGRGVELSAFAEVDPRKIGQRIYDVPVLDTAQALAERSVLHLGAVGQKGAREQLRRLMREGGLEELKSFVLMA